MLRLSGTRLHCCERRGGRTGPSPLTLRRARLRLNDLQVAVPPEARRAKGGGADRDRTDDLLLAKQALSQLSYGPSWSSAASHPGKARDALSLRGIEQLRGCWMVGLGRLELPTSLLSSARSNQTELQARYPRKKDGAHQNPVPRPNKGPDIQYL